MRHALAGWFSRSVTSHPSDLDVFSNLGAVTQTGIDGEFSQHSQTYDEHNVEIDFFDNFYT